MLVAIGSSLLPKADAQNTRARFQQDLAQVFSSYEQMTVDPRSVTNRCAHQVECHSSVWRTTLNCNYSRTICAPSYRAEETDADGVVRAMAMPGITTYKGNVEGPWASDARFTIDDNKVEGMIITPTILLC